MKIKKYFLNKVTFLIATISVLVVILNICLNLYLDHRIYSNLNYEEKKESESASQKNAFLIYAKGFLFLYSDKPEQLLYADKFDWKINSLYDSIINISNMSKLVGSGLPDSFSILFDYNDSNIDDTDSIKSFYDSPSYKEILNFIESGNKVEMLSTNIYHLPIRIDSSMFYLSQVRATLDLYLASSHYLIMNKKYEEALKQNFIIIDMINKFLSNDGTMIASQIYVNYLISYFQHVYFCMIKMSTAHDIDLSKYHFDFKNIILKVVKNELHLSKEYLDIYLGYHREYNMNMLMSIGAETNISYQADVFKRMDSLVYVEGLKEMIFQVEQSSLFPEKAMNEYQVQIDRLSFIRTITNKFSNLSRGLVILEGSVIALECLFELKHGKNDLEAFFEKRLDNSYFKNQLRSKLLISKREIRWLGDEYNKNGGFVYPLE